MTCQCPPSNWCGDVMAWPGLIGESSVCKRCMKHDPHDHRPSRIKLPDWEPQGAANYLSGYLKTSDIETIQALNTLIRAAGVLPTLKDVA